MKGNSQNLGTAGLQRLKTQASEFIKGTDSSSYTPKMGKQKISWERTPDPELQRAQAISNSFLAKHTLGQHTEYFPSQRLECLSTYVEGKRQLLLPGI